MDRIRKAANAVADAYMAVIDWIIGHPQWTFWIVLGALALALAI